MNECLKKALAIAGDSIENIVKITISSEAYIYFIRTNSRVGIEVLKLFNKAEYAGSDDGFDIVIELDSVKSVKTERLLEEMKGLDGI